jgi:hypothetical protein
LWIILANAVYPVLDVDWYIFDESEKWDDKAWAAMKRGSWLDKFKEALALVWEGEMEALRLGRGAPDWATLRVLSGCRRSNKEKPGAPKGQKSPCFKISMHIILRNNQYLMKGTEDMRHGQHSMNLVKQFVKAIIQKMKDVEGADMGIYSTKRAFRVMGAAKVTFADGLKQSATLKQLVLPRRRKSRKGDFPTVNWPAEIGTEKQEDLLYTEWCEHTASVEVGSRQSGKFTNWCVKQWQLDKGEEKMMLKSVKVKACDLATQLGADVAWTGRGHKARAFRYKEKIGQGYIVAYDVSSTTKTKQFRAEPTASLYYSDFQKYLMEVKTNQDSGDDAKIDSTRTSLTTRPYLFLTWTGKGRLRSQPTGTGMASCTRT